MTPAALFQYRKLRNQGISHEEIRQVVLQNSQARCDRIFQRNQEEIASLTPSIPYQEQLEKQRQDVESLTKKAQELESALREKSCTQTAMLQTKRTLQENLRERQVLLSSLKHHQNNDGKAQDRLYAFGARASRNIARKNAGKN
ncbi:MAG: hypothetical protein KGI80_04710 [Verrucomicrobiota bacterium]|nr:hypothetical protein [Verrucomicrobiota bacterium]